MNYHVKSGFRLRKLGSEFILIGEGIEQVNFNKMITMNETAAFLWEKVQDGTPFDAQALADRLCEEYEVSPEQALHDAQAAADKWLESGIIDTIA